MHRETSLLICLMAFLLGTGQIWRDKTSRKNAEGNELYRQKNYAEALQKYIEAEDGKSHQQELSYNIADVLYRQKKYPEAIKELEKSVSSNNQALNQKIYFNRGNSFYQMGQYPQAVKSYKKALEVDPKDRDAKHNLELALKKMQEKPQSEKQNSENKDPKEKNSSKDHQQAQNQQSDSQKQPNQPQPQDQGQQNKKTDPKQNQEKPDQPQKAEQKPGMDTKEALRILDAINNQEKKEQRKQILRVQRERISGKDW